MEHGGRNGWYGTKYNYGISNDMHSSHSMCHALLTIKFGLRLENQAGGTRSILFSRETFSISSVWEGLLIFSARRSPYLVIPWFEKVIAVDEIKNIKVAARGVSSNTGEDGCRCF